jgi:hypothetical protein
MGDIFQAQAPTMKIYYRYIRSFKKSAIQLAELKAEIPAVSDFLVEQQAKTPNNMSLESLLIMPGIFVFPRHEMLFLQENKTLCKI